MFDVDLYVWLVFLPSILFCSILQIVLTGQFGTRSGPLCLQCEFQCVHSAERYDPVLKAADENKTFHMFLDQPYSQCWEGFCSKSDFIF